ncbi:M23 family metallopeptidase [Leptospira idonii]|uniref:M23 family metallopeptidase n=2 Tax=Leptospira idonii TaxID=1193500 RepID=A0A4R9M4D2_9LEPT|nr:M23 family metallopeptidase [Leptospira idonii]
MQIFQRYPDFIADSYEFPAGGKYGEGYYIAQKFGVENPKFGYRFHLGEDWNYVGGGDSDYGAPVYSISNGIVSVIADYGGGWGKVVRVIHKHPVPETKNQFYYFEALYAHLYTIEVEPGQMVKKGEWIASIGDAGGAYPSHLHFELRTVSGAPLGGGYSFSTDGFFSPTKFLIAQVSKEKAIHEDQFGPAAVEKPATAP